MFPDRQPRSFLDLGVLSRLAGFPLFARKPMLGSVSGRHPSPHRGSSVEFAEYRKYVPGDDLRRLDWRAYGRSDRHYVKEFEADTNLRCCLVLDTSGSMDFGSTGVSKLEYARRIAATIGLFPARSSRATRLGSTLPGRRDHPQDPAASESFAPGWRSSTSLEQASAAGRDSAWAPVLHELLAETISQRASIIITSDLFVEPDELRSCFQHLRFRKHDVAVFHLLDPQEVKFDFRRPMRFLDMEGGPSIFAEPNEIAERYLKAIGGYLESDRSRLRARVGRRLPPGRQIDESV